MKIQGTGYRVQGTGKGNTESRNPKPETLVLLGPTASGKTDVAIHLAKELGAEIISADSRQIYRGMDIGTAKPTKEQLKEIPHHLIDIVNPDEEFTVYDFVTRARRIIFEIQGTETKIQNPVSGSRFPVPGISLIVGGTGFYMRALADNVNLARVPADTEFRASLRAYAKDKGEDALHARLAQADPEEAKKIHPHDVNKIIRALEILHVSGKPKSFFKDKPENLPLPVKIFGLQLPRAVLCGRIERRVDDMLHRGLVEEVKVLLEAGYDETCNPMTGIGYRQIIGYLKGEHALDHAVELIKRDTRRFAKRQMTYFKTIQQPVTWIDASDKTAERIADEILMQTR